MWCNVFTHDCCSHNPVTFPDFPFYLLFLLSPGLLVSRSWMAGGMASAFPFFTSFFFQLQCILIVACIEAVCAISHPQLSGSLSLTLNHCTVLCEKWERRAKPSLCWLTGLNQHIFTSCPVSLCTLLSHFVAGLNAFNRRKGVNLYKTWGNIC